MNPSCPECDHTHTTTDTIAVGRFLPAGPQYRAQYVNSPLRTTRAAAERDMCRFRQSLHPEPQPEGLWP